VGVNFHAFFMHFYFVQNINKELWRVSKLDRYGRQNLKKMKHFKHFIRGLREVYDRRIKGKLQKPMTFCPHSVTELSKPLYGLVIDISTKFTQTGVKRSLGWSLSTLHRLRNLDASFVRYRSVSERRMDGHHCYSNASACIHVDSHSIALGGTCTVG